MQRRRRVGFFVMTVAVAAIEACSGGSGGGGSGGDEPRESADPSRAGARSGLRYLSSGDDAAAFARATTPRPFTFPRDHGGHPEFRSEWWYFTGNLETDDSRHFGFELTFFRFALSAEPVQRASEWGATQAWMANFAVTDTAAGEFSAAERFARGALGLAGAEASPFRVWVEDWSVDARQVEGEDDRFVARLAAREGNVALDLELVAAKEPVANGERGLDRKGAADGNASYYYSISRLDARGAITTSRGRFDVRGLAWLDREWGTSALEPGTVGWDWIALQLEDGRDLMYYRIRQADGAGSRFSGGSLIAADGARRALTADDVLLEPRRIWKSPATGARYPIEWRLAIPAEGLELEISPYLADQELDLAVRYWEGAVRVSGSNDGAEANGRGYLELAGY